MAKTPPAPEWGVEKPKPGEAAPLGQKMELLQGQETEADTEAEAEAGARPEEEIAGQLRKKIHGSAVYILTDEDMGTLEVRAGEHNAAGNRNVANDMMDLLSRLVIRMERGSISSVVDILRERRD